MTIWQLIKCYCGLSERVAALEAASSDDQQISGNLSGNIFTITLEDGGSTSLDLTPYLPDGTGTDDQQIQQFAIVGGNLVLTLENGGTASVPLSSFPDLDQQTLSLVGTNLTILNGNTVDLSGIDTDDQTLSTTTDADGNINGIVISDGNTTPVTVVTDRIFHEKYFLRSANATTVTASRNASAVRTGVGQWTITLSSAHSNGVNFHPSFTAEEQGANRDTPDITIVQGTQNNSTTFDIQITTGDNGGVEDVFVDTPWSMGISDAITVVTAVTP